MAIVDGLRANASNTNTRLMSRTVDTNTVGELDLENVNAGSGASVINVQREVNSLNAYTGRPAASAHDATPIWVSVETGGSTDTLKDRAEALDAKFANGSGHAHSGAAGDGAPIDLANVTGQLLEANGTAFVTIGSSEIITGGKVFSGTFGVDTVEDGLATGSDHTLDLPSKGHVHLSNGGLVSIRGVTAPSTGAQLILLTNGTGVTVSVRNSSGTIPVEDIVTGTGVDLDLINEASLLLVYDVFVSKWRVVGGSGTGGGAPVLPFSGTFSGTVISATPDLSQTWVYESALHQTLSSIDVTNLFQLETIEITGGTNTGTITVEHNDVVNGIILNGTWVGSTYSKLTLSYDGYLQRFIEVSRNGI